MQKNEGCNNEQYHLLAEHYGSNVKKGRENRKQSQKLKVISTK